MSPSTRRVCAAPKYINSPAVAQAPPGHRFSRYFSLCDPTSWEIISKDKDQALDEVASKLGEVATVLVTELTNRQYAVAESLGAEILKIPARLTAPLVTGMGEEHPCENGFAFSLPHGLPVLRGSGVKGVLRRAAEDLALLEENSRGWDIAAVWLLFGFDATSACFCQPTSNDERRQVWADVYRTHVENRIDEEHADSLLKMLEAASPDIKTDSRRREWRDEPKRLLLDLCAHEAKTLRRSIHYRGALDCWDLYPVPGKPGANLLFVDVLTPHQSEYLLGKETPHDSGRPNPCPFLAVEPLSRAALFTQLGPLKLTPDWLTQSWSALMDSAFDHAASELGFGAKTAVGYGRMERDDEEVMRRAEQAKKNAERAEELRRLAAMSPVEREINEIERERGEAAGVELYKRLKNKDWSESADRRIAAKKAIELLEKQVRGMKKLKGPRKEKHKSRLDFLEKVLEEESE